MNIKDKIKLINKSMYFKNEFWAFIPARAGSRELKNKNITKLAGLPLIAYSIKTAKKIKLIKKIVISSDSKKYLKLGKKYGCNELHLRSKKNSGDTSSELSVFKEFINKRISEKKFLPKYFVHLRPTTPVRNAKTVQKGIKFFQSREKNFTGMRSVSHMSEPAYRYFRIINKKLCSINKKDFMVDNYCKPRAYYTQTFKCNCIVDIYKTETILKNKLFGTKVLTFLTKDFINDIDDKHDLRYTEYFIKESNYKI